MTAPPTQPVFAVSGNPPNFLNSPQGGERLNAPAWLAQQGLDGLEISCTHGVNISAPRAANYRAAAAAAGVRLYVHAPYYIALASGDSAIRQRSRQRIVQAMTLAEQLDATRVVFHPGGFPDDGPHGREAALARLIDELRAIPVTWNPARTRLCAEIGGKVAALGSLDEIITICQAVPWVSPCLDFAHLHARTHGGLPDPAAHIAVIETLRRALGDAAVSHLHCHVYSVAYNATGERCHVGMTASGGLTDLPANQPLEQVGPDVSHFIEAVAATGIIPSVVCESKNSQDLGALCLRRLWQTREDWCPPRTAPARSGPNGLVGV